MKGNNSIGWKEASKLGFSQVMGMPGVAFYKAGRYYSPALIEVQMGAAAVEPEQDEESDDDSAETGVEDDAGVDDAVEAVGDVSDLQARLDAAKAALRAFSGNSSTGPGKKEYARLYAAVRRAKEAIEKSS